METYNFIEFDNGHDFSVTEYELTNSIPIYYQEIPTKITDNPKNSNVNLNPFSQIETDKFISKIYKKYKFSEFTGRSALKSCFSYKTRPKALHWNPFLRSLELNSMLSSNKVGNKITYRFNIRGERNNPNLTYDCAIDKLKKRYDKDEKREFTASSSRRKIRFTSRPDLDHWKEFLEYLVSKDILKFTRNYGNSKKYSF